MDSIFPTVVCTLYMYILSFWHTYRYIINFIVFTVRVPIFNAVPYTHNIFFKYLKSILVMEWK